MCHDNATSGGELSAGLAALAISVSTFVHEASVCPLGAFARESAIRPVFNRKETCWPPAANEGGRLSATHGGGLTETSRSSRTNERWNGVTLAFSSCSFTFNDLPCPGARSIGRRVALQADGFALRSNRADRVGSGQIGFECKEMSQSQICRTGALCLKMFGASQAPRGERWHPKMKKRLNRSEW